MEMSPRARGEDRRQELIADAMSRGIRMTPVTRTNKVCYLSPRGRRFGIPWASEKSDRPDRWFLGLRSGRYDGIVLLCDDLNGKVHRCILPPDFSGEVLPSLSTDQSVGQIKFEVTRSDECLYLQIPYSDPRPIDAFLENFDNLLL